MQLSKLSSSLNYKDQARKHQKASKINMKNFSAHEDKEENDLKKRMVNVSMVME